MSAEATLSSLLEAFAGRGSCPALGWRGVCGSYWFRYIDLYRAAHAVAANLAARRLPERARIVLWAPNSPEWVACLLGAALRGLVTVPCDATTDTARVTEIVRQTGAPLILCGPQQSTVPGSTPSCSIFEITRQSVTPSGVAAVPVTPDDEAVILFTSGSSSAARGVVLTHRNLMSQLNGYEGWRRFLRIAPVRMLALSPLSHVQGLILGALLPLSLGLSVLYSHSLDPSDTIQTIRLGRIAILLAVPRVLELLECKLTREIEDRFGWDAHSAWRLPLMRAFRLILGPRFRVIFTGGATLTLPRERFWRRAGTALVQGYGATETTAIATINWPLVGCAGSVGIAHHGAAIRLADDGEIEIRGPQVSPGYAASGTDRESLALTEDGYYPTGDYGRLDRRNRLFLTGRKRDLIVTAEGNNVDPGEIESALAAGPGVRDALVTGIVKEGGEEIHAVLLLHTPADAVDAAAAIQHANAHLANGCRIQSWSVWPEDDFPRGALGKIRRGDVIRRISNCTNPPRDDAPPTSLRDCAAEPDRQRRLDRLAGCLIETKSAPLCELAGELTDLGLDSMDLIQLAARMDEVRGGASYTSVEQVAIAQALPAGVAAGLRPGKESAPRWQLWPGLTTLRAVIRAVFVDPIVAIRLRTVAGGASNLSNLTAPCIFALHAEDRRDSRDYLAVYRAAPRRFARRLLLVMRSNPPDGFAPYLHPGAEPRGWPYRMLLAGLFHVGLPLTFPFALFPASTTRSSMLGLAQAGAAIERGLCPLVVWGSAAALLAAETRCPVVPVRLRGVNVRFGVPLEPQPGVDHRALAAAVDQSLAALRIASPGGDGSGE